MAVRSAVSILVSFVALLSMSVVAVAVEPSDLERGTARRWVEAHLGAKIDAGLPFAFTYGGKASKTLLTGWKLSHAERSLDPTAPSV